MDFEPKKFSNLFEDMRNRSTAISDFEVGSVARTVYESFSYELALLYEKMRLVYLSAFVDTAQGSQLDNVVAILGVKRGLPDFAEGEVSFIRDKEGEEIEIPLGTLVATEDTPEDPKKVYQTIEAKTLKKNQSEVAIKVIAINRGEEQNTNPGTVVIMPRPVPGIKSVNNTESISLVGKKRETDVELRQRAKNALISSGKATILSIENAVLSLPGVVDIKVVERFRFAKGIATLTQKVAGSYTIPKDTEITARLADENKPFITTEEIILDVLSKSINIRALLEGEKGALPSPTEIVSWSFVDTELESNVSASISDPIVLGDFGVIEVYVDGPDFKEDPEAKDKIKKEIERVRAAGIFVVLDAVQRIEFDGVFRISPDPGLSLSPEEVQEFEQAVAGEIEQFLRSLKMGQGLNFNKLVKALLDMEGVEDLLDFRIETEKTRESGEVVENNYLSTDKSIDIDEVERFHARYVCVASEDKLLPIDVRFQATDVADGETEKVEAIQTALSEFFNTQSRGTQILRSAIAAEINSVPNVTLSAGTLDISARPWCDRPILIEEAPDDIKVMTSFVEQLSLGNLFVYNSELSLTGAISLSLSENLTTEEKEEIRKAISELVDAHLDSLAAEETVLFEDLIQKVLNVNNVLDASIEASDFQVHKEGTLLPERVSDDGVEVKALEKSIVDKLCISGDTERLEINITDLDITTTSGVANDIETMVINFVENYLGSNEVGEDLIYADLKSAIETLLVDFEATVTALSFNATSLCDSRLQTASITNQQDVHVRSIELTIMNDVPGAVVSVTVTPPPPPPDDDDN